MSRSIHRNWSDYWHDRGSQFADEEAKRKRLEETIDELRKKQRVKREARRKRAGSRPAAPTSPETIRIRVGDESGYVHYPADENDVREILARLPAGSVDGLEQIDLCLGAEYIEEREGRQHPAEDEPKRDPFVGRISREILPGVYASDVRGSYRTGRVWVYAFVYDRDQLPDGPWEVYLRLLMLSVLVHELGHHEDYTLRAEWGRWTTNNVHALEHHAERRESQHLDEIVIPYLRETCPDEVPDLEQWVRDHIGVSIPLVALASGEAHHQDGEISAFRRTFGTADMAFCDFVCSSLNGKKDAKLDFARDLYFSKYTELALSILDATLEATPFRTDALTLKARILVSSKATEGAEGAARLDEAECLVRRALKIDPKHVESWQTLLQVFERRGNCVGVIDAANQVLGLIDPEQDRNELLPALELRARARLRRGEHHLALDGIEPLVRSLTSPWKKRHLIVIQALAFLCLGRHEEAKRRAISGLELADDIRLSEYLDPVFEAIQFEANSRLGDPNAPLPRSLSKVNRGTRTYMQSGGFPWSGPIRECFGLE